MSDHSPDTGQMVRTPYSIFFQSACSGLWYTTPNAAGSVKAIQLERDLFVSQDQLAALERELAAVNAEVTRMKETLSDILPALERASGCSAKDLARPGNALTADEVAALWMARAIMEGEL